MGVLSPDSEKVIGRGKFKRVIGGRRLTGARKTDKTPAVEPVSEVVFKPKPMARVCVMCGVRGEGKSTIANHWGCVTKKVNRLRGIPWKLFSNIPISYADEYAEDMYERIQMDETGWYSYATVLIDELPEIMNAKRSMSGAVVAVEAQLRQLRKDFQDLIGTAQFPQELTGTMLRQVDFLCLPQLRIRIVKGLDRKHHKLVSSFTDMWNWNGSITKSPHWGKPWPPPLESADKRRFDYGIEQTWDLFDTESKTTNIHTEIGKRRREAEKFRRELFMAVLEFFGDRSRMEYDEFLDWLTHDLGATDGGDIEHTLSLLKAQIEEVNGTRWLLRPVVIDSDPSLVSGRLKQRLLEEEIGGGLILPVG